MCLLISFFIFVFIFMSMGVSPMYVCVALVCLKVRSRYQVLWDWSYKQL